jgi:hypothetical protein
MKTFLMQRQHFDLLAWQMGKPGGFSDASCGAMLAGAG